MHIFYPTGLVLAMLVPMLAVSDFEPVNSWSYKKNPTCVDIPEDLRLCYTVGYHSMRLPNLLEHETMAEVKQQAGSWVPLVHKGCHPSTQVLLCSLFAPVCLDTAIYPCRRLCEAVQDGCMPIMEAFGFPWPSMLNCSKFPEGEVCIDTNDTTANTSVISVCPPCDDDMSLDAILEHMCASEFTIKAKIKEVRKENNDKKVILQKSKAVRLGNLKKEALKKMVLYLRNGEACNCQQLDSLGSMNLLMGRKVGKRYLLTGIHKWDKSKEFKKTIRRHKCPNTDFQFK
ncbi:secreted frizzled-related protein 1b [Salminus brasiliensis]|uniref:secreted frizzled-related protein 1b n=1 Tax=Salminus brasiliensis TaxID=930266 RepID=UPI003B838FE2